MEERGVDFRSFATFFEGLGYSLFDAKTERQVSLANYRKVIPPRATTDLVAVPLEKVRGSVHPSPQPTLTS